MAPQGIGAMITMPIAGTLADRVPIGRTVPFAMLLVAGGFFGFTQVHSDTSYVLLCGCLFVMGLGMGGTMMPIMTSALRTLDPRDVARGSTLVNILQQIGSSVGAATMSVILTSELNNAPAVPGGPISPQTHKPITDAALAIAHNTQPEQVKGLQIPAALLQKGLDDAAHSFATTFVVGFVLVLCTFIPIALLPKRKRVSTLSKEDAAAQTDVPVMLH
jgi:MFS family permease